MGRRRERMDGLLLDSGANHGGPLFRIYALVDRSDGTRWCTSRSTASGAPLSYALHNHKPRLCKDWCSNRIEIRLVETLARNTPVLLGVETIITAVEDMAYLLYDE